MKTKKKALLLALCALLLVVASVFGTMAYLTDTETVTNTFTVGKVYIDLDEAPVDGNGQAVEGERVKANTYHLLPGHSYDKDPIVHVLEGSDECYLFVIVKNELGFGEDVTSTAGIDAQMKTNGWVYWKTVNGDMLYYYGEIVEGGDNIPVFTGFKILGTLTNEALQKIGPGSIVVTAYAVQADGFADARAAGSAGFAEAFDAYN